MLTFLACWGARLYYYRCLIHRLVFTSVPVRFLDTILLATYVLNSSNGIASEFVFEVAWPVGFASVILYAAAV